MSMRRVPLLGAALVGLVGCSGPDAGDTYYEHFIEPVLLENCATGVSGCHKANEDDPSQFAAGNLDVTSFENVQKRRDLLTTFGAYSYPALLIKAASPTLLVPNDPEALTIRYNDQTIDLEIAHSGQGVLDVDSEAFGLLLEWTQNGATANGLRPPNPAQEGDGPCSNAMPGFSDQEAAMAMAEPFFQQFRDDVQPVLDRKGCGAGTCHGAPQADFYITCGDSDREIAFNYVTARSFVANPVDQSQLLFVPLATEGGGPGHSGGDQFPTRTDGDYTTVSNWAAAAGPVVFGQGDAGKTFFKDNVQPIFLQRGCSFMNCHSPGATNDFKLRSGSPGFFSAIALEKNYELIKNEFMALEYPDSARSRFVSKNILPDAGGIRHRGGPVLETPGRAVGTPTGACPGTFDPSFSPYCTIQEWFNIERAALGGQVSALTTSVDIVYVDRPGGGFPDNPIEFDVYRGGSNLMRATAPIGAGGTLGAAGAGAPIAGSCPGFNAGSSDIRAPDVAPDGNRVAFAMRNGQSDPLGVYVVDLTSGGCNRVTPAAPDQNGMKIHNFDPVWSPDGQYIVFASTRGASGPTRSRRWFHPQSDLWRVRADGSQAEQITFLSNSEFGPAFMREGRITMTTEKTYVDEAAQQGPGVFYQLAGRRINWDKTDYHPLLAQRARSPYGDIASGDLVQSRPSVDYAMATDIRERSNGDFLLILADPGARGGGGALAIFNRSAGAFEAGRGDAEAAFLESMIVVDRNANPGRLDSTTAYRSPYGLPDGQILASYSDLGGATLSTVATIDWDVVAVDVGTQKPYIPTHTTIIGGAGAQMDAVLVIRRPPGVLFYNKRQLVFGGQTSTSHTTAHVHFPDAPMVFTLLTGNLRRGRPVDAFREARQIVFFEEGTTTGTSGNTPEGVFQMRNRLGAVDLAEDGSARAELPSGRGVVMQLLAGDGSVLVSMGEEHQFGPGEEISLGIAQPLFNAACGGCHGSVSGSELDNAVTPDVLTGASASMSAGNAPAQPR